MPMGTRLVGLTFELFGHLVSCLGSGGSPGSFAAHFGATWHPSGPFLGPFFLLFRTLGALLAVLGGLIAASRSLHRLGCVAVVVFWLFGHCLVAFGVEFDNLWLHPSSCIAVWSHRV